MNDFEIADTKKKPYGCPDRFQKSKIEIIPGARSHGGPHIPSDEDPHYCRLCERRVFPDPDEIIELR